VHSEARPDFREAPDFRGAGDLTRAIRAPFYLFVPLAFGLLALVLYPWHRYLTFTVEIDFPRFAGHALSLDKVLVWDPFVPFGYPFLLWALTRLGLSVFAAGHAKNVWMGMHGQGNWAQSWQEAEQQKSLLGLIQADPVRFFSHWTKEAVSFGLRLPLLVLGLEIKDDLCEKPLSGNDAD